MPRSVPFRVVLIQGGVARKFFSLYEGRDGTRYIHPDRDGPWVTPKLEETPGRFSAKVKLE
jgi:hypothetical protein